MNKLEEKIYNKGERCIPFVTHNEIEAIRHQNRYSFFRKIIENDIINHNIRGEIKILDLGCGAGYGSEILSYIPNSNVTGIDVSIDTIKYAQQYYNAENIEYMQIDIREFISRIDTFDYVVSSEVIEHITDGFELFNKINFNKLLMISSPYMEKNGSNIHHHIFNINEGNFRTFFRVKKFYFQTTDGMILSENMKRIIHPKSFRIFIKLIRKILKYDFRINNIIALINP